MTEIASCAPRPLEGHDPQRVDVRAAVWQETSDKLRSDVHQGPIDAPHPLHSGQTEIKDLDPLVSVGVDRHEDVTGLEVEVDDVVTMV